MGSGFSFSLAGIATLLPPIRPFVHGSAVSYTEVRHVYA